MTREVMIGNVRVGGGASVKIQSMNNTDTRDAKATLEQIRQFAEAGCDITRVAIPDMEAAEALKEITAGSPIPVVADIHFDYKLAIASARNGAAKIRINPGNIGGADNVKAVVDEEAVVGLWPGIHRFLDPSVAQPLVQPGVAVVAWFVVPKREHFQHLADVVVVEVLHALVGQTHGVNRDPLLSQGIDEALRHVRPSLRALGVAVRKKYHFLHGIYLCSRAAFKGAKARSRFKGSKAAFKSETD